MFAVGLAGCANPASPLASDGISVTPMQAGASATGLLTPDITATEAARVIQQALTAPPTVIVLAARTSTADSGRVATAVAATLAAQATATATVTPLPTSTPLPTATPTPDFAATQTEMENALATAVAATLTAQPTPAPTSTSTPNFNATQTSKDQALATAVAATLTASAPTATPVPRIYNFAACLEVCTADHTNARRIFPEGAKKLYLEWNYENLPVGARYTRVWTLQGRGEWVRYQCAWPGPPTGMDKVTLSEPDGLHSGIWEVTIAVNDIVLMREQITVEGNWNYWFYAGTFESCYGKLH